MYSTYLHLPTTERMYHVFNSVSVHYKKLIFHFYLLFSHMLTRITNFSDAPVTVSARFCLFYLIHKLSILDKTFSQSVKKSVSTD